MLKVLEAVPNFSEGRDLGKIEALVDVIASEDVDVLDWSADPDHHRSVVTYVGAPEDVVAASLAAARFAVQHIDLRRHQGVHPRVGALDVLPFVPLEGMTLDEAAVVARGAGHGIAELGVPVYFYGHPLGQGPKRGLATLRRGGFEALSGGFPEARRPDLPAGATFPHESAGVTCVGARPVLLAWNVFVEGMTLADARAIATRLRERDGGFVGLRALGLELQSVGRLQISMNLEDPGVTAPLDVFRAIESEVAARGGQLVETQVIGMMPDALVLPSAGDRLNLPDLDSGRVLSRQVDRHVRGRLFRETQTLDDAE